MLRLILLTLLLALAGWWLIRLWSRPKLKCATCRHCRKLFDDGSLCGFGKKETFKNLVHVHNCVDHQRR